MVFGAETLPATSVQVALTDAEPESGPEYVADVHELMPDIPSDPDAEYATAWLYQPFASGARASVSVFTVGGVASRLIVTSSRQHCEPLTVTEHVNVTPDVSCVTSSSPQPCGLLEPPGSVTETWTRYQPLLHDPPLQLATIPVSVRAAAGSASATAASAAATTRNLIAPPR